MAGCTPVVVPRLWGNGSKDKMFGVRAGLDPGSWGYTEVPAPRPSVLTALEVVFG